MVKSKKYPIQDDDEVNLTNMVREGVAFNYFARLSDQIHLTMQEWSEYLHLSQRTMQRYKKEQKTFDPIHAEKIVVIELLYKKGVDVFGRADNFYTWMDTISIALGNVKPKNLLDTSFGITMVYNELGRIEHGIFA